MSFKGFAQAVRNNPKKSIAAVLAYCYGVSWAVRKWRATYEREIFTDKARVIGRQPMQAFERPKRFKVIINRRSGSGNAVDVYERDVEPILQLSGADTDVVKTKYRDFARSTLSEAGDIESYDGILVIGGDGLLQEVVTGLLQNPKHQAHNTHLPPIGVIPVGTSSQLGQLLDSGRSRTQTSLACRATLGAIRGNTSSLDIMELSSPMATQPQYAVGSIGWGLFGAAAMRGQGRRWPGSYRYDLAAFISLLRGCLDETCEATLSWQNTVSGDAFSAPSTVRFSSFMLTNTGLWCRGRTVDTERTQQDGQLTLAYTEDSLSFSAAWSMIWSMIQGRPLVAHPAVKSVPVTNVELGISMPQAPTLEIGEGDEQDAAKTNDSRSHPLHGVDTHIIAEKKERLTSQLHVDQPTERYDKLRAELNELEAQEAEFAETHGPAPKHSVDLSVDLTCFDAKPCQVRLLPARLRVFLPTDE